MDSPPLITTAGDLLGTIHDRGIELSSLPNDPRLWYQPAELCRDLLPWMQRYKAALRDAVPWSRSGRMIRIHNPEYGRFWLVSENLDIYGRYDGLPVFRTDSPFLHSLCCELGVRDFFDKTTARGSVGVL